MYVNIQSICLNLLCLSNRYELRKLLKFRVLFLHSFILPLGVLASKKYETKLGLLTLTKSLVWCSQMICIFPYFPPIFLLACVVLNCLQPNGDLETWSPITLRVWIYRWPRPLSFCCFFCFCQGVQSQEPRAWETHNSNLFLARIVMAKLCSFFFFVAGFLAISWALVNANLLLLLLLALSIIGTEFRMHLANHNHDHRATQIKASAPPDSPHIYFFFVCCYTLSEQNYDRV